MAANDTGLRHGRVCRVCDRPTPLAGLVRSGDYYGRVCQDCASKPRQGVPRPPDAPDPAPCRRVRRALAQDIRDGVPWSAERFDAIVATSTHSPDWRLVLRSTRAAWEDAYEHRGERLMTV